MVVGVALRTGFLRRSSSPVVALSGTLGGDLWCTLLTRLEVSPTVAALLVFIVRLSNGVYVGQLIRVVENAGCRFGPKGMLDFLSPTPTATGATRVLVTSNQAWALGPRRQPAFPTTRMSWPT